MINVTDDNLLRHRLRVASERRSDAHPFVAIYYTVRKGDKEIVSASIRDNPNAYRKD